MFYISQVITVEEHEVYVEYVDQKSYFETVKKEFVKPFCANVVYSGKKRTERWKRAMKLAIRFVTLIQGVPEKRKPNFMKTLFQKLESSLQLLCIIGKLISLLCFHMRGHKHDENITLVTEQEEFV